MNAKFIMDREFLEMRSRLIDLAASMDRMERGEDASALKADPRSKSLREAIHILAEELPNRAIRMQMHFSDAYNENWYSEFRTHR